MIYAIHEANRGRYRLSNKLLPGYNTFIMKPPHETIADMLLVAHPELDVYMDNPYDYGHSAEFVVEQNGDVVLLVVYEVMRNDLE